MTSSLLPEEKRVRDWLQEMGFLTEHEPIWLGEGKKPEFWACGPHDLWVEVKRLTPPLASQKGAKFFRLVKETSAAASKVGHGLVSIEAQTTQQAVEWIVSAINSAVEQEKADRADHHFVYVGDEREETIAKLHNDVATTFRIRGKVGRSLPSSIHLPQECWRCDVTIIRSDGAIQTGKFFQYFEILQTIAVGRAQVGEGSRSFGISTISSGDASNTPKLRSDLKNSGKKFRAAVQKRPAPALLVVVPDFGALVTEQDVAIAAFGDLTVVLSPTKGQPGYTTSAPFLHRNGVLRGGSHSSISGIVLFYEQAKVIILNKRAEAPLSLSSPLFEKCERSLEWEL